MKKLKNLWNEYASVVFVITIAVIFAVLFIGSYIIADMRTPEVVVSFMPAG